MIIKVMSHEYFFIIKYSYPFQVWKWNLRRSNDILFFPDRFPIVSFMLKTLGNPKLVNQGLNNFYACEFPFGLNVCILLFQ